MPKITSNKAPRMVRALGIQSTMTLLSRILGLVRDVVLMGVFGASGLMDAFLVAFRIPNFLRRLFAEGAFTQAFVPVLTEYKTTKSHAQTRALIARVFGSLMLILLILSAVVVILAPWVIRLFAPGFVQEPTKLHLATDLLRLTFPYLLFVSMTAFLGGILNTYGRFTTTSFAPVCLNVCLICGALLIAPHLVQPMMALGYAVAVAGILQMLILMPELWARDLLPVPKVDFAHEGVKKILTLIVPSIFGVSVTQINLLLNTMLASLMASGSVSWLYTAERLSELPNGIIAVGIGVIILPALSRAASCKDQSEFTRVMDWAARLVVLVGMPAAVALFVLAGVLIDVLFVRGKFDALDADMSAFALRGMTLGVLCFMLIKVLAPAFYAHQDAKTPVRIGMLTVGVNIACSVSLVGIFYVLKLPMHGALAWSASLASIFNVVLLYRNLHRKGIWRLDGVWRGYLVQVVTASALLGVYLWVALMIVALPKYLLLAYLCLSGLIVYGLCLWIFGVRPRDFLRR